MSETFILEVTVKFECIDEFVDSFDVMKSTPGFECISLYQDPDDCCRFICVEVWQDRESHQAFVDATTVEVAEKWLALLAEPPKAKFYAAKKVIDKT